MMNPKKRYLAYAALLSRDGDGCFICGEAMDFDAPRDSADSPTVEHKHPRSVGGGNHLDNLALTHKRCNAARGDAPLVATMAQKRRGPLPNPVRRSP